MKNAVFWNVMPCGTAKEYCLQELHGVPFQKTAIFIVPAMKTSNLEQNLCLDKTRTIPNAQFNFN
jgi:hypothetical protein